MKTVYLWLALFVGSLTMAQTNYVIGTGIGDANDTPHGTHNTFVGSPAIPSTGNPENWENIVADSAHYNVGFGHRALRFITTGDDNTAIGAAASDRNTSGNSNTAVGRTALQANQTGNSNVAVGRAALNLVRENNNVGVGALAGRWLTLGSNNLFLGAGAGSGFGNGSGNVFIGSGAGVSANYSNRMYIHNSGGANPLIYGEFDNRLLRLNVNADSNSRVIVNSFANHTSGLRFQDLTSASPVGTNPGTGVLTVDANGDVILVEDVAGSGSGDNDDWHITGNSNIDEAIHFMGTTTDEDVRFKRNNVNAGLLDVDNTAFGNLALNSLAGTGNSVFGSGAMSTPNFTESQNNSVFGKNALSSSTTDGTVKSNSVFGAHAMLNVKNALNNAAVGSSASANRGGNYNAVFGHLAGYWQGQGQQTVVAGNNNTMLGALSGYMLAANSINNTFVGSNSGRDSSGESNVYLGMNAGGDNSGSFNVFLGVNAGNNADVSRKLYVDITNTASPLVYGEFDNRIVRFNVDNFDPGVLTPPFSSRVDINGRPNESGLRFMDLTSAFTPTVTNTKFLTVNANGDVVLEKIPATLSLNDVSIYSHDGSLDTSNPLHTQTPGVRRVTMKNNNLFFDTSQSDFKDKTEGRGRIYIGNSMLFPVLNLNGPNFSQYRLLVEGGILTEKVKVALRSGSDWADYVFAEGYKLMPLNEVESFIKENKHLPGVASACELAESGLDLAEMQAKQMEKIEELTLHLIEQNKTIEKQNKELEELKEQVRQLLAKQ